MPKHTLLGIFYRWLLPVCAVMVTGCGGDWMTDASNRFHISGRVTYRETGGPVVGLVVGAVEAPISANDYHESTVTREDGSYELYFSATPCKGWYLVTARTYAHKIRCESYVKGGVIDLIVEPGR